MQGTDFLNNFVPKIRKNACKYLDFKGLFSKPLKKKDRLDKNNLTPYNFTEIQ